MNRVLADRPATGGLPPSAVQSSVFNSSPFPANLPLIPGRHLKHSRFWETAAGDRVRSARRGPACSANREVLRQDHRQLGMPSSHYRAESILGSNPSRSASLAEVV